MTPRSAAILGLLVLAGLLGNFFALPLFFGADFLFGSLATLLVLYVYGLGWGLAAAVAINGYTYFLWGHPYGFIIFLLEALVVGVVLRRRRRDLFVIDGLFWLLIGIPLNIIFYYVILRLDVTTTIFIILKQFINGIFNALLASLVLLYGPCHRFLSCSQERRTVTLKEAIFGLLVALVLLPALILTSLQIRGEMRRTETTVTRDLQLLSSNIQTHLQSWHGQRLNPIAELAQTAGRAAPGHLQQVTEILKRTNPDFLALHVENAAGVTIACAPATNERGSTLGIDLSSRDWFKRVAASQEAVLSEVFLGERLFHSPILIISVPVLDGGRFHGAASGTLDLQRIQGILATYVQNADTRITLMDQQGRVVASSAPERKPMTVWDRTKDGIITPMGANTYRWSPAEKHLTSTMRWKQSFFVQETLIGGGLPWSLVVEASIAPSQQRLYAIYVQNLTIMAVLAFLTLILGVVLSRKLAKPLTELAEATTGLPARVINHDPMRWPESPIAELDSLIGNFRSMTIHLEQNFQILEENSRALALSNEALKGEIGERRQAEEEKLRLLAQLAQSQKMESLGSLAGGVAHDMNNVLGAILGLASAHIRSQPSGSPLHQALDTICKATERGGKMVKSLLSFARQKPAEDLLLDMNAIIQEQVALLERTTLAKVHLRLELDPGLRPMHGDPSALAVATMNLCVNAVDAMADNGTLTLRTRNVDGQWLEVTVEDTGAGMAKEVLDKAMDPFFTTKGVGKGTGLGLSMVYATVKAHGGQIALHSEPGHGTRVVLRFPACVAEEPGVEAAAMEPGANRSLKVLLVDDDELIQSSMKLILAILGHEVAAARCGEDALAMVASGYVPEVVILDMNMPGLSGTGTLPRLRALLPNLPVILATGRTDQVALDLAAAHPGVVLLPKPYGLRELQQGLRTLIRG